MNTIGLHFSLPSTVMLSAQLVPSAGLGLGLRRWRTARSADTDPPQQCRLRAAHSVTVGEGAPRVGSVDESSRACSAAKEVIPRFHPRAGAALVLHESSREPSPPPAIFLGAKAALPQVCWTPSLRTGPEQEPLPFGSGLPFQLLAGDRPLPGRRISACGEARTCASSPRAPPPTQTSPCDPLALPPLHLSPLT